MSFINYCNVLLKNNSDPSFVVDFDTYKVLYLNPSMEQLLSFKEKDEIIGEEFCKLITNGELEDTVDLSFDWEAKNIHEYTIFDNKLKKEFKVKHVKMVFENKPYILVNYEQPNENVGYDNIRNFELAMSKCISALQKVENEKNPALLKILGEYYKADKTHFFHIDRKNSKLVSVGDWAENKKILNTPNFIENLSFDTLLIWCATRNEVGIVETSRRLSSSFEAEDGTTYVVENVAMCVITNINKEPIALVSISNRKNESGDLRLLQAISNFLEKDITKAEIHQTVQKYSDIDLLTGFYSRVAYSQKIDELLLNLPKTIGVFFSNVNGLKAINSEFGYAKGDSFIKKSATYLQEHLKYDFYRTSGDEFICFVYDLDKQEFDKQVNSLMKQIKEDNNNSFALGYAWGGGRVDIDSLIKEADTVMYINKQEYYHSSNRNYKDITDTTLSDLISYIKNEEFMIYLQPQVKLSDGSLYGAEALIRRFDKTNEKMVFPDQFIPLYERKSVIRHVDIFVVEQVCKLLSKWNKDGVAVPISVNLSRVTLQEFGIVDTISKICDEYQVLRELLVIEVTERVGLVENNVASSLIKQFKEYGFKISLDDFGCAYSNIVTLAQIEVDEVKIDKSLVDELTVNKKNHVLVKNVLSMCNELEGTSTLAEGIEDEEQAKLLHELGCHLGQGYHYSRPIPVEEFCEIYGKNI